MPASLDFPRGVALASGVVANGAAATVTFPANPGLSWVITEVQGIEFVIVNATIINNAVEVFFGGVGPFITGIVAGQSEAAGGTQIASAEWDWSGSLMAPLGVNVVVTFQNPSQVSVRGQIINAAAYPV